MSYCKKHDEVFGVYCSGCASEQAKQAAAPVPVIKELQSALSSFEDDRQRLVLERDASYEENRKLFKALSSMTAERDEYREVLELLDRAIGYATECNANYVIETLDKKIINDVLKKYPHPTPHIQ
jgi:hypothetical protein